MLFKPSFPATCNLKCHRGYQGVQTKKEQESKKHWVGDIKQDKHTTYAAANGKGTSGGHDSNYSHRVKQEPFKRTERKNAKRKKPETVPKGSKLYRLDPFVDKEGVL